MLLNQILELSLMMDGNRFQEILSRADIHEWDEERQEYTDASC